MKAIKLFAVTERYNDAQNKTKKITRFILSTSRARAVSSMRTDILEDHPHLTNVDVDKLKMTAKQVKDIEQVLPSQRADPIWWDPLAGLEHEPEKFGFTPRSALRALEKLVRKNAR